MNPYQMIMMAIQALRGSPGAPQATPNATTATLPPSATPGGVSPLDPGAGPVGGPSPSGGPIAETSLPGGSTPVPGGGMPQAPMGGGANLGNLAQVLAGQGGGPERTVARAPMGGPGPGAIPMKPLQPPLGPTPPAAPTAPQAGTPPNIAMLMQNPQIQQLLMALRGLQSGAGGAMAA